LLFNVVAVLIPVRINGIMVDHYVIAKPDTDIVIPVATLPFPDCRVPPFPPGILLLLEN
jgi:hypothetical protein